MLITYVRFNFFTTSHRCRNDLYFLRRYLYLSYYTGIVLLPRLLSVKLNHELVYIRITKRDVPRYLTWSVNFEMTRSRYIFDAYKDESMWWQIWMWHFLRWRLSISLTLDDGIILKSSYLRYSSIIFRDPWVIRMDKARSNMRGKSNYNNGIEPLISYHEDTRCTLVFIARFKFIRKPHKLAISPPNARV